MINLLALIKKDKRIAEAVDKIVGARIEFDADDLCRMEDDISAIVEPFYDNAVKEVLMDSIIQAKEAGKKKETIRMGEIVERAISKAVESFNDDSVALAKFWAIQLEHLSENVQTEKDARDKILQLANDVEIVGE